MCSLLQAVRGQAQRAGGIGRHHVDQLLQLAIARHLPIVGEDKGGLQRVAMAQRIPGVHDRIVADTDVDACGEQLFDPGMPATDGIPVEAPLQDGIVEGIRDHVQAGSAQVLDQAVGVGVVVRVHRGGMARRHPAAHPQPDRLRGQHLHEARLVVVGLVAVYVDLEPVLRCQLHHEPHRLFPVLARQLVVRNAADDVRAQPHGLAHQPLTAVERVDALLRERHEL